MHLDGDAAGANNEAAEDVTMGVHSKEDSRKAGVAEAPGRRGNTLKKKGRKQPEGAVRD